jgi:hypothetical protein
MNDRQSALTEQARRETDKLPRDFALAQRKATTARLRREAIEAMVAVEQRADVHPILMAMMRYIANALLSGHVTQQTYLEMEALERLGESL